MNFKWGFNWRFGLGVGISIYFYNLIIEKYWPDLHKLYKAIFAAIFVGFFFSRDRIFFNLAILIYQIEFVLRLNM